VGQSRDDHGHTYLDDAFTSMHSTTFQDGVKPRNYSQISKIIEKSRRGNPWTNSFYTLTRHTLVPPVAGQVHKATWTGQKSLSSGAVSRRGGHLGRGFQQYGISRFILESRHERLCGEEWSPNYTEQELDFYDGKFTAREQQARCRTSVVRVNTTKQDVSR
jgi:hypothetical protein